MACETFELKLSRSETVSLFKQLADDLCTQYKMSAKKILKMLEKHFEKSGRLDK